MSIKSNDAFGGVEIRVFPFWVQAPSVAFVVAKGAKEAAAKVIHRSASVVFVQECGANDSNVQGLMRAMDEARINYAAILYPYEPYDYSPRCNDCVRRIPAGTDLPCDYERGCPFPKEGEKQKPTLLKSCCLFTFPENFFAEEGGKENEADPA